MTRICIKGRDIHGKCIDIEIKLREGTITENGHCRFIFDEVEDYLSRIAPTKPHRRSERAP